MKSIRAIPEKNTWGGGGGGVIVVRPNQLHGCWYFAAWKGKKEYYLPKKERSFIKSSQKKALSLANHSGNSHFCLHAIVKPLMFPLNIGKKWYRNKLPNSSFCSSQYFTWETCIFRRIYSRKQRNRVVRPLVKANTFKYLYQ